MMNKIVNFVEEFPSIEESQVLSDDAMLEIEGGGCSVSCKTCQTNKYCCNCGQLQQQALQEEP